MGDFCGVVGDSLGGVVSVLGDMGSAYSGLAPVLKGVGAWLRQTVVAQKLMVVWTKVATAVQWLWNAALSANPIGIVIVAIGALVAAIVWLANKVSGWGEAWKAKSYSCRKAATRLLVTSRYYGRFFESKEYQPY